MTMTDKSKDTKPTETAKTKNEFGAGMYHTAKQGMKLFHPFNRNQVFKYERPIKIDKVANGSWLHSQIKAGVIVKYKG